MKAQVLKPELSYLKLVSHIGEILCVHQYFRNIAK